MDPIKRKELLLKQADLKQRESEVYKLKCFNDHVQILRDKNIEHFVHFVHELDSAKRFVPDPHLDKIESFPFMNHGCIDKAKLLDAVVVGRNKQENVFAAIKNFSASEDPTVIVLWKDYHPTLEIKLSSLVLVAEELIDFMWDTYVFEMFGDWVVEFHHDDYITYGRI